MTEQSYLAAALILVGVALGVTWILMLAVGNFDHARFGYGDCFPAGLLLAWLGISDR